MPENLGWSGGNNAGIKLALERNYDLVCLLNNDTVLPQGAMARLAEPPLHSGHAACTPRLIITIPAKARSSIPRFRSRPA